MWIRFLVEIPTPAVATFSLLLAAVSGTVPLLVLGVAPRLPRRQADVRHERAA